VSGGWKTAARPPKSAPDPPVSAPFRRKTCRTALCLRCPRPISYLRRASLGGAEEPLISEGHFSYSALKHWQKARVDVAFDDESTTIKFPRKEPPFVEGSSIDNEFLFTFDIRPELRFEAGEVRTRNETVFEIKPTQPKSLEWMFEIGYRVENFFCLLVGSSLNVQAIAFKADSKIGRCRRQIRGKTDAIKVSVTVKLTSDQLAKSISLWLGRPDTFRLFESSLYTIREENISHRTKLLTIANALEGFHRLTTLSKDIVFKDRIDQLISKLSPAFAARLLDDPASFALKLRDTRNYLTHPGLPLKPSVLTDDHQMFLFSNKCEALLRFLVLNQVGLDESTLADPIYQQSRLWS
jgi:hypothetical protein